VIFDAQIAREREDRLQFANRWWIIARRSSRGPNASFASRNSGSQCALRKRRTVKFLLNPVDVARIALRACTARDVPRLVSDGVLAGAVPAGESWPGRVAQWLEEMKEGRRLVMVAEFDGKLAGMAQLIFRFANGYQDPEAANGADIAMIDSIRMRPDAPANLSTHIIVELEKYAKKHRIRTVTFLVPMDNNRALSQVKSWGFEEFRIMPEGAKLLAFFRKRIA
jgi:hypothetical protein